MFETGTRDNTVLNRYLEVLYTYIQLPTSAAVRGLSDANTSAPPHANNTISMSNTRDDQHIS
jgi:hypothetical protein